MRRKLPLHALLLLSLLLSGCAHGGGGLYGLAAQSWVGAPAEELIAAWGEPDGAEPMPNGDMAVMAWEQEFGRMCDAEPEDFFPIYEHLIAEAARRGLDLDMPAFAAGRVATPDEFPG